MVALREQLVDIGISEYGHVKALDALSEVEVEWRTYGQPDGHIDFDFIRLILLDVGKILP